MMQRILKATITVAGMAAVLLAATVNQAEAQSSTKCSSRYKLAWEMPLRSSDVGESLASVLKRSEFSAERIRSLAATSIARAPDGTVALQETFDRGRPGKAHNNTFYLDQLGNRGVDAACLSVKVYLEKGFEWPIDGPVKMGWGLWGGDKPNQLGGGVAAKDQLGWSVRNVTTSYGFRLYSYNLNRSGNNGQFSRDWSPRWGTSEWNDGRWHEIQLEVVMNSPGRSDGYAQFWLDGSRIGTMDYLVFRRDDKWAIRGLQFNAMLQGTSPKHQKMWYADYKLYSGNDSTVVQAPTFGGGSKPSTSQSSSSSNNSGGGKFGAVAPSGTVSGSNVTLTWNADPDIDRYYVKLVTSRKKWEDRKTILGRTVNCNGSRCSLDAGKLPRDQYEWMVRWNNGSKQGPYSKKRFTVK